MSFQIQTDYLSNGYNRPMTPYEESKLEEKKERMGVEDPAKELLDKVQKDPLKEDYEERKKDKNSPDYECETCKNRKYKDGSNEMVSFKSAQHIPQAAVSTRVRAHEQEHVSNAFKKAEQNNGKVVQASVQIHTAVCPECGRTYVSGGTTTTQIKYYNEENPYQQDLKTQDASKYAGMNVDTVC